MGFKEELKQKLIDMKVFEFKDPTVADRICFHPYGFSDLDGWPEVDTQKDLYEDYKLQPEYYEESEDVKPGLSLEDFIREYEDEDYNAEKETLDCENFEVQDSQFFEDRAVLKVSCGGDWQIPHDVEITYFGGDKFEIKDLGLTPLDESFDGEGKEFFHQFGLKAPWEC